jgi:hypothetical protein
MLHKVWSEAVGSPTAATLSRNMLEERLGALRMWHPVRIRASGTQMAMPPAIGAV